MSLALVLATAVRMFGVFVIVYRVPAFASTRTPSHAHAKNMQRDARSRPSLTGSATYLRSDVGNCL